MNRALRLLHGDELVRRGDAVLVPALEAQPFRPGELPGAMQLELTAEAAELADGLAASAGIPLELWVRLAVEATRHLRHAASALDVDAGTLAASLDEIAAEPVTTLSPMEGRLHRAYAKRLREARPRRRTPTPRRRLTLAIPDQVAAAWGLEAARSNRPLADYVSGLLGNAWADAVSWEASAAEYGEQLAEWVYKRALRFRAR